MTRTRKVALVIVVAFVIYAVYNNPDKSAAGVSSAFDMIGSALHSLARFFDRILSG